MKIDILTTFGGLNIQAPRSNQNAGGGMASLINAAKSTLSERYAVNVCAEISALTSDFVLLDAIFLVNGKPRSESKKDPPYTIGSTMLEDLEKDKSENPDRKYLFWCAEKTFIRFYREARDRIHALVDGIVVTCPYLWHLFEMVGFTPMGFLCDAIDPNLFRPAPKRLVVTSVGALKHIKNIDWVLEVYRLLEGKIKRMHLGGADLWSPEGRPEDLALIRPIQQYTDEYHPNASIIEVAYHNAYSAIAVNNTWHDCSSRANEELLMSGVISVHGQHPLFDSRPGFRVRTPAEAVDVIAEITNNFTQVPDARLGETSREWALKNVSADTFRKQFEYLVRCLL